MCQRRSNGAKNCQGYYLGVPKPNGSGPKPNLLMPQSIFAPGTPKSHYCWVVPALSNFYLNVLCNAQVWTFLRRNNHKMKENKDKFPNFNFFISRHSHNHWKLTSSTTVNNLSETASSASVTVDESIAIHSY